MNREISIWKGSRRLNGMVARYAAVLLTVLTIVIGAFYALESMNARMRAAEQTRLEVRRLLRLQIDEETGIRGFVITRQRAFLEPYYAARPALHAAIESLSRKLPANQADGKALAHFALLHSAWESNVARPVLSRRGDALSLLRERTGKSLVDRMRADFAEIDAVNAARSDEIAVQSRSLEYATMALIIICILAIASIGYVMERRSAKREEALLLSIMEKRDSATRLSEWRSKVVAMLAHDFKSALGAIRAYTELLEDFPERRADAKPYQAINESVSQLSAMADEALFMARIATDNLTVTGFPVRVEDVAQEAADRYRSRRDIAVSASPALVLGDRAYLLRVFDNLISNAVKYSEAPVEVSIADLNGETVEICVKDTGAGISANELPHVFDEYWRSPSASPASGSGVGLFIVKKIVEAHHGSISVESAVGAGTTVRVRLPAAGNAGRERAVLTQTSAPWRR